MKVTDLIQTGKGTAFSFEVLPPLKGNSIGNVYKVVDRLLEFAPKYVNITSHHSEAVYREQADGTLRKMNVRKRPGSVAIASAIQNKYHVPVVPHILCKGFTKEETEYALIDLSFLGVFNLLLLRGDDKSTEPAQHPESYHTHATGLQEQVNDFNRGIALDGSAFTPNETPFSYGMACYPEKHEEAPNMASDLFYAKKKVEQGADYLVTQMFFDNAKYYAFVEECRAMGITVPIIPGIKPVVLKNQLTVLPRVFRSDIPEAFAIELRKCKDDVQAKAVGVEWCVQQCRDLIAHGVPSLHFYTLLATESVYSVAKEVF
jgi:methylenetetrahydrofolate reductase (NADPH)